MHRRVFVGALACGLVRARSDAQAQAAPNLKRIGYLTYATVEQWVRYPGALKYGLRGLGYVSAATLSFCRAMAMERSSVCPNSPHVLRDFTDSGLLVRYGANLDDLYRRAASYVVRIFRGARPGELAVEQPTKFDLVINIRTAKALGIPIPQSLLARADQVTQ